WKPLLQFIQREYNEIRPHEALDMDVPASRYRASARAFNPSPKKPEYPTNSIVAEVDSLGRFSYRGFRLFASEALAGESVRILELQDSGLLYYRQTPLRVFNLNTGQSVSFPNEP